VVSYCYNGDGSGEFIPDRDLPIANSSEHRGTVQPMLYLAWSTLMDWDRMEAGRSGDPGQSVC